MKLQRGFTLIELILVMALVGILSVIGIGNYTQGLLKSRDTQRKNDLNQIAKALELYNNDFARYAKSDGNGVMTCTKADGSEEACSAQKKIYAYIDGIQAVYLERLPGDPASNKVYFYEPGPNEDTFALYAALENTEDKDVVVDGDGKPSNWSTVCGSIGGSTIYCNYKLTETGLIRTK